jgi:integrase
MGPNMAVFLRGSSYYLKIRHGGRQVLRSLDTTDRAEALTRAGLLLKAIRSGVDTGSDTNHAAATARPCNCGEAYAIFAGRVATQVAQGHVRPSYELEAESLWAAHLSRFQARLIDATLNRAVVDYLNAQRLSVARRRKAHTLFRKLASLAGVTVAPHRFTSAQPAREKRPLTVAQLQSCRDVCLSDPRPTAKLIYLAAVTGARIGEVMALTPADVGPDYISISKTRCRKTGAVVSAKTRTSRRTIPVASAVIERVRPAIGQCGHEWFPVWRAIRKKAGLGVVGVHVLRHTWATHALAAGVTPKAVSLALGHASVSFTESQYARFLTADYFRAELATFNRGHDAPASAAQLNAALPPP